MTATIPEREWAANVIELARRFGWCCYFTHDSRHSPSGFPDLTMARDGRLLFVELKSERGKVTFEQEEWLNLLSQCSCEVFVWRPSDLEEALAVLLPQGARVSHSATKPNNKEEQ